MRNMSFSMTTEQFIDGSKDVTRRFGWWFLKPGDRVRAEDSMAATEPLLPTQKLVEHSRWMRAKLREANAMLSEVNKNA